MKPASPVQWDLLGIRVFIAVGAAVVVLMRDVQTVHLSFGSCLFHAARFRAERGRKRAHVIFLRCDSFILSYFCSLRHVHLKLSFLFIFLAARVHAL